MFACQAALVIANARRYRDERRARNDLETLINTSPVGVVVFDAEAGIPVSINREAGRIVSSLQMPDRPLEDLLEVITYRRADGREISLDEFPLAQALSTGETVRLEEIVMEVPDGRSVKTLINATPIRSQEVRRRIGCRDHAGYDAARGAGTAARRIHGHGEPRAADAR